MMITLFSAVIVLATFSPALPVLAYIFRRKGASDCQRSLALLAIVGMLTEHVALFSKLNTGVNLSLLHLYTPVELSLISLFYYQALKPFVHKWIVPAITLFFIGFSVINSFYFEPSEIYNSYARGLECLIVISYSIIGFYRIFIEMKVERLVNNPEFWAYSGFLLYFSTALFIFIFSNQILQLNKEAIYGMWAIHAVFVITLYLALAISISKDRKT